MHKFAFIIHPIGVEDVLKKFKFLRFLPTFVQENFVKLLPVCKASNITGVRSSCSETSGWFVLCPLTSSQILNLPVDYVLKKIIKAGKLAQRLGADIVGLGAMTSVVGDAGETIASALDIPVTTGNSYTVATAMQGTIEAAKYMGVNLKQAKVVVVGATGSIGRVCSELMAREVNSLTMVARDSNKLDRIAREILYKTGLVVRTERDVNKAVSDADIILTVTSAVDTVIEPEYLKPGAVVCDVARPRDVSKRVKKLRDDVLIVEGGVVDVPGPVNFHFDFGFPHGTAYACMAETMILALEGRLESYTLGRTLTVEQVEEISLLADKHGFRLAGLRSFEKALSLQEIEKIKMQAQIKQQNLQEQNQVFV